MSKKNDDNDITFFGAQSGIKFNKKDNHIGHPDVEQWLDSEKLGFKPTSQQEKFKQLAYRMAKRRRFFRNEWFEATREKNYKGTVINERTWNRWCKESEHFKMWFYEDFPYVKEVSEEEFSMMDAQYWTGVRDAMTEGEEWAYRQYAKTRFDSAAAKKDQADSESLIELRTYFSGGGGDAWSSKPGEA